MTAGRDHLFADASIQLARWTFLIRHAGGKEAELEGLLSVCTNGVVCWTVLQRMLRLETALRERFATLRCVSKTSRVPPCSILYDVVDDKIFRQVTSEYYTTLYGLDAHVNMRALAVFALEKALLSCHVKLRPRIFAILRELCKDEKYKVIIESASSDVAGCAKAFGEFIQQTEGVPCPQNIVFCASTMLAELNASNCTTMH